MAGQVTTLYSNSAKTNELYPRTKTSAVSDADNHTLGDLAVYNAVTVGTGVSPITVGWEFDLLWTNESPTSSFTGTVSINLTDYKWVAITFRRTNTDSYYNTPSFFLEVGTKWWWDDQIGGYLCERSVETTTSSVVFGDSSRMGTYPNGSRTTDNTKQIPYQIFGIRGVINDLTGD